jgi:hypothetical protein
MTSLIFFNSFPKDSLEHPPGIAQSRVLLTRQNLETDFVKTLENLAFYATLWPLDADEFQLRVQRVCFLLAFHEQ